MNENTLFATVALYIQESSSLLLVVEGPDDHLALKDHCSPDLNLLSGTGGREQVLRAARLASERNIKGVRFLVDRDYDDFRTTVGTHQDNVLASTRHDIFLDISASEPLILQRVIDVFSDSARRRPDNVKPIPHSSVIESDAISLATALAAVRIVNARRSLALDFTRFSFGGLKEHEFKVEVIANTIFVRNECRPEDLDELISESISVHAEVLQLQIEPIGDHDLFSALARILKRINISISGDSLHKAFILAVTCAALSGTHWFQEIQKWCELNNRRGFSCQADSVLAA
ncbi:hypothetical protein ACIPVK_00110 [Paeniglutamicibacter sp. MACA_103]|uniref:hypothetical protein n=1 Tax=Paeniglutamicibacter sp. MACA_103 TaxID=3377337 RepID=UPI003894B1A5